jgi:hypothetical protein
MSNYFKKVLYFGPWDHIEVVNYFPKCNEFILIDTQPRSQHDEKNYFYEGFYRDTFLNRVIEKCEKYGFILDNTIELDPNYIKNIQTIETSTKYMDKDIIPYINPHLFIFKNHSKNDNRIIKYYISTNILFNMNQMLEDDIRTSDTLYVAGYFPDIELLKYINKKINFVGDNDTVYFYEPDPDENNIIIAYRDNYISFSEFNYYLVWREKSMIIVCDSLEDIDMKKNLINVLYANSDDIHEDY